MGAGGREREDLVPKFGSVTFEDENGKTRFRLHQKLFETVEYCDQHRGGWTQCIDRLAEYVEKLS